MTLKDSHFNRIEVTEAESWPVLRGHDFQDAFANSTSDGNGAYARKGTFLRVMVAIRRKVFDQIRAPVPEIMDGCVYNQKCPAEHSLEIPILCMCFAVYLCIVRDRQIKALLGYRDPPLQHNIREPDGLLFLFLTTNLITIAVQDLYTMLSKCHRISCLHVREKVWSGRSVYVI
jgi:hypothetical protein